MELARRLPNRQLEVLSVEDVLKRLPLLRRIVRDLVTCYEHLKKSREFLEELTIISRKFSSSEIEETVNRLRREVTDAERMLEAYDKEARELGSIVKDRSRGLAYFYSVRDNRKIFLVWELRDPDNLCWHELDETYSDRLPVDLPAGAQVSGDEFPSQD